MATDRGVLATFMTHIEQQCPFKDRSTTSSFWSQLSLKFKEIRDANQHFYELKQ